MFALLPGSVTLFTADEIDNAIITTVGYSLRLQGYPKLNINAPSSYVQDLKHFAYDRDWSINGEELEDGTNVKIVRISNDNEPRLIRLLRHYAQQMDDILILVSETISDLNFRVIHEVDNLIRVEAGSLEYVKTRNQAVAHKTISIDV